MKKKVGREVVWNKQYKNQNPHFQGLLSNPSSQYSFKSQSFQSRFLPHIPMSRFPFLEVGEILGMPHLYSNCH